MKRALFESVRVLPYASGDVIDRDGMLSGVLGVSITGITGSPTAAQIAIVPTHCDTADGTFEPIEADASPLFWLQTPYYAPLEDGQTALQENISLDYLGCKRYVKLVITIIYSDGTDPSGTASFALALGDPANMPV